MTRLSKNKQLRSGKQNSFSKRPPKKDAMRQQQQRQQLRGILANANAKLNPLELIPSAFLSIPLHLASPCNDSSLTNNTPSPAGQNGNGVTILRHFSSPLPPNILQQCLRMFKKNMGDMYSSSKWGLDMEQKSNEMQHSDARFLIVLSSSLDRESVDTAADTNDDMTGVNIIDADCVDAMKSTENCVEETINHYDKWTVLGFAHFRYEYGDDDHPRFPVTYLYELQVHSNVQKLGIGKKLMSIVELISVNLKMEKVMLTVFRANVAAMAFYKKRNYNVDECSPSNFTGEENENCDYEILSKIVLLPREKSKNMN
jgi:ribosomal protein S18 acetylase RimI-like enzyme